jgi:hypothetical protein
VLTAPLTALFTALPVFESKELPALFIPSFIFGIIRAVIPRPD